MTVTCLNLPLQQALNEDACEDKLMMDACEDSVRKGSVRGFVVGTRLHAQTQRCLLGGGTPIQFGPVSVVVACRLQCMRDTQSNPGVAVQSQRGADLRQLQASELAERG